MQTISVKIANRVASFTAQPQIFSGTAGVDKVSFDFDDEWSDFPDKFVMFAVGSKVFYLPLDEANEAVIPGALLERSRTIGIAACAKDGEEKSVTSSMILYKVGLGAGFVDSLSADECKSIQQAYKDLMEYWMKNYEGKTPGEAFEELKQYVDSLEDDFAAESDMTRKMIGDLGSELTSMGNAVSSMNETVTSMGDAVNVVEEAVRELQEKPAMAFNSGYVDARNELHITNEGEEVEGFIPFSIPVMPIDGVQITGGYVDDERYLHLTNSNGDIPGYEPFQIPAGGGGSGGPIVDNAATLTVKNTSGFLMTTKAEGHECILSLNWTSIEDDLPTGDGVMQIVVDDSIVQTQPVPQGDLNIDVAKWLRAGTHGVKIQISDCYGNTKNIIFTVNLITLSVTSSFDRATINTAELVFPYVPIGAVDKTVIFKIDDEEIARETVTVSNRQMTYVIPKQAHGSHKFELYFIAEIDGVEVESNHLLYDLVWIEAGNETPVISTELLMNSAVQYDTINIPYMVYNPASITANIQLYEDDMVLSTQTVDRTRQVWSYRALTPGEKVLKIVCGEAIKTIPITITQSSVNISAETQSLTLHLSSYGRSNSEENPAEWKSGDIECTFDGFSWRSDGWVQDEDGITVLRVPRNGKVTIPYQLFKNDCRPTGKTIEFEISTHHVQKIENIIECIAGGIGLVITPQLAKLTSEQSEVSMQFKEDEHLRVSFVIQKRSEQRLLLVYIDGVMSGAMQYPDADNFMQARPVDITITGNGCSVDVYNIRVYDNDLTKEQMKDNWIADTQIGSLLIERYQHNDVYDAYGQIVINKLPKDLPYCIISCPELPQFKGDKKTCSVSFTDPTNSSRNFTENNVTINVQGTSSQYYARKNYKLTKMPDFVVLDGDMPAKNFCFKADVASSEGANNVMLARLYDEVCPAKTPTMVADPRVQWSIHGFPMVVFWNDGVNTTFLGKYNFNHDKSAEANFGFKSGDESWETLNNTSDRVIYKSDDFSTDDWQNDFEARYPEDNLACQNLAEMVAWVKSTDGNKEKFKAELEEHFDLQSSLFYWLFTELFLMVDSRAKNTFPTWVNGKWYWYPYDFDTAIGINNEGQLVFGFGLEDTDKLPGDVDVFNGQQSVFWNNLRDCYSDEIKAMYQNLRSTGRVSYEKVEKLFADHQGKWCEAIVNEDSQFKYLDPLIEDGNSSYLTMLQGLKSSQRKWWLYYRFRYMDSKYAAGDSLTDVITLRGYAKSDITVTPFCDIYPSIKYGSYLTQTRAKAGETVTLACPLDNVNDTEIYIYSASLMSDVGDLSGLMVGYADFTNAQKLEVLRLGGDDGYENPNLTALSVGNSELLKEVNVKGCINLTGALDLSHCDALEKVDARNTKLQSVVLPQSATLKELYLPETITNLTIINQPNLEILDIPTMENVTTLRLENFGDCIDPMEMVSELPDGCRMRIIGLEADCYSQTQIANFLGNFDRFTGLDENGSNTPKPQITGKINFNDYIDYSCYNECKEKYPYFTIIPIGYWYTVEFRNADGTTLSLPKVRSGNSVMFPTNATKASTDQYTYTLTSWSENPNSTDQYTNVKGTYFYPDKDCVYYPVFRATTKMYNVYFYNADDQSLESKMAPYGSIPTYTKATPVDPYGDNAEFIGWNPKPAAITRSISYYAQYADPFEDKEITDEWDTILANVDNGTYKQKYKLGNYKKLTLASETVGTHTLDFRIAGVDKEGDSHLTWIADQVMENYFNFSSNALKEVFKEGRGNLYPNSSYSGTGTINVLKTNPIWQGDSIEYTFVITATRDGDIKFEPIRFMNSVTVDGEKIIGTTTLSYVANQDITISVVISTPADGSDGTSMATFNITGYWKTKDFPNKTIPIAVHDHYEKGTGTDGGWENSYGRSNLNEHIMSALPENIQNHIVPVPKKHYYYDFDNESRLTTVTSANNMLWVPAYCEVKDSNAIYKRYMDRYGNSYGEGKAYITQWGMRDAVTASAIYKMIADFQTSNQSAHIATGLKLGFCI